MIFVKGKLSSGKPDNHDAFYNLEHFIYFDTTKEPPANYRKPKSYNAYGVILTGEYSYKVTLRDGFLTQVEAERWLAKKFEEWGIVIDDLNH